MKGLSKTFLTGLFTVAPMAATLYFLVWLFTSAESGLGRLIRLVVPDHVYRPGMGLVAGLILIFLIGLLMHAWIVQRLFVWGERFLDKIPLVRTIYGSLRDFVQFFSRSGKEKSFHQVVMVSLGETGMELMGFVTREDFRDLPPGIADEGHVAVYFPMGYQIGGYAAIVPRSSVRVVDMPMEKAMRFILTAGMTANTPNAHIKRERP